MGFRGRRKLASEQNSKVTCSGKPSSLPPEGIGYTLLGVPSSSRHAPFQGPCFSVCGPPDCEDGATVSTVSCRRSTQGMLTNGVTKAHRGFGTLHEAWGGPGGEGCCKLLCLGHVQCFLDRLSCAA